MPDKTLEEEHKDFMERRPFDPKNGFLLADIIEKMFTDNEGNNWKDRGYTMESATCKVYFHPGTGMLRIQTDGTMVGETTFAVSSTFAMKVDYIDKHYALAQSRGELENGRDSDS